MIALDDIIFRYDESVVLKNVSLSITDGERIAVMGANGSGKSTLALIMKGLLHPDSGSVLIDGEPVDRVGAGKVGMVFQNPENQLAAATVEREIAFGLENIGVPRLEMVDKVQAVMQKFNLTGLRNYPPHRLSGGQMQKVSLASVMVMEPDYMILDEPTALLDPRSRKEFIDILMDQPGNIGIIYITQIAGEALLFDRAIALNEGELVFDGSPASLFDDDKLLTELSIRPPVRFILNKWINR